MASKRIATSAVDWAALAVKMPAENKAAFTALKMKVDKNMRSVNALPEAIVPINFEAYRAKINIPGMVDNFEKQYKALDIPYPSDQGTIAQIDAQAATEKGRYTQFVKESDSRIAGYNTELAKWEAMKPVEEMNLEEALDAGLTQFVIDPNVPSFFPHDQTWEEYIEKIDKVDPKDFH